MMEKLRNLLLVEDDDADAELTLTALEEYHLANHVIRVSDGEEALDYLFCRNSFADRKTENPAVILLDLKMPKIGGIEVLEQIRRNKKLKFIPVVVLTSSHEDKDLKTCYKLGVNAYVVKPVDFNQFAKAAKETGAFWGLYNEPPPSEID